MVERTRLLSDSRVSTKGEGVAGVALIVSNDIPAEVINRR